MEVEAGFNLICSAHHNRVTWWLNHSLSIFGLAEKGKW